MLIPVGITLLRGALKPPGTLIISNPKKNILRFPDKLEHPLRITFCPPKGLIYPSGKSVGKKFKKWAQEYNIPSWERKRLPFLYYGDSLAAIVGLFVCTHSC